MQDEAAVLFVNEEFYRAFAGHDIRAMDALWSRQSPVTCIHPGWEALSGRDTVMDSWAAILTSRTAPSIVCHTPRAFVFGTVAYVVCYESVDGGSLVATNVFVRENDGWKMVHHQAGASPARVPPASSRADPPVMQ